jgi:hypothetical protein
VVRADAEYAIARGREVAESLMLDTCTIVRLGELATDPETGVTTPSETTLYTGKAKVQGLDPQEMNPEAGGATLTVQRYRVDVPVGSYRPAVGDVVEIGTARLDPNLIGRRYRVVALLHKSYATAYRMAVEEA